MKSVIAAFAVLVLGQWIHSAHAQDISAKPGDSFRDCANCPEMVVVPEGSFQMGLGAEKTREQPIHKVTFAKAFAVGKYDVTFDEWDACAADGGCGMRHPNDFGWGRGRRPVVDVSWDDAVTYTLWLSKKTGKTYRLPSEAEWEYVARAGSTTKFWWGDGYEGAHANCSDCGSRFDGKQSSPVGSFRANAFGLFDTAGNVSQWVEDRWNNGYAGAPIDGSAWETGDQRRRVMRNGSWYNRSEFQRPSYRQADAPAVKSSKLGFRVALSL